jgi:hypothetical protein
VAKNPKKFGGLLLTVRAAMLHNVRVNCLGAVGNRRISAEDASSDPRA